MECSLKLKSWKISTNEDTKLPKVEGSFVVLMGDKEIASQNFNAGYGSKELPFSDSVINAAMGVEEVIRKELERLLA